MTALEKTIATALPADFEELFQKNYELVFRAAQSITGNPEDAEDVLQTLFVRLLRREFPPQIRSNPKGYLYRSAINLSLELARSRKARPSEISAETASVESVDPQAAEIREWFQTALQKLNPSEAEVFVLRHIEGYSNAEIASLLGTSRGTVAVTLFRARSSLKKSLKRYFGERT